MPSIFTLSGSDDATSKKPRRKRAKKSSSGKCVVGTCKDVYNGRTKRHIALCCTGLGRSGQTFMSAEKARIFKSKKG